MKQKYLKFITPIIEKNTRSSGRVRYFCKSSVDSNIEMNGDSELVKHFECNKVTPNSKINWVTDYGSMFGGIMGSYAHCPYCDEKLHTDYRYPYETKEKEWMGYMVIQGKNTITVKS